MQKIAVLMSTYNGEKFVREQIQSIIFQKISEQYILELFVRDDGSTDTTPKIVDLIASQFADKISVVKDESGNLGVKKSFIKLVENIDADFYFFADQDDIWLTDKVETMVNILNEHAAYSAGVYSDLWIVDAH